MPPELRAPGGPPLPGGPPGPGLRGAAAADQRRRLGAALLHPRYGVEREYAVGLRAPLDAGAGAARSARASRSTRAWPRCAGLRPATADGAGPAGSAIAPGRDRLTWYRAVLTQGWRRQLRRMFAAVGAPVERLVRVRIGTLRLDDLRAGERARPEPRGARPAGGLARGSASVSGLRVALDRGPGSSGKASVGRGRSAGLGYRFCDTGRALPRPHVARRAARHRCRRTRRRWSALVPELTLVADDDGPPARACASGGRDVTDELHAPRVDRRVSVVSRQPEVRAALLPAPSASSPRPAASSWPAGTSAPSCCPTRTSSCGWRSRVEERARRRAAERDLAPDSPAAAAILADLRRRDDIDSSRDVAPLRVPDDAVIVQLTAGASRTPWPRWSAIIRAREAQERTQPMSDREGLAPYPRFIAGPRPVRPAGHRAGSAWRASTTCPRSGPLIIAANHMSNADPPFIGGWLAPALRRRPTFLAKEALFDGPLGLFIRSLGAEPVKAGGSDIAAYRVAKAVLDRGGVVAILPEGTRSFDGVLAQPKPGVSLLATRTGAPVLPVGISGTDRLLGRGGACPPSARRIIAASGSALPAGHPGGGGSTRCPRRRRRASSCGASRRSSSHATAAPGSPGRGLTLATAPADRAGPLPAAPGFTPSSSTDAILAVPWEPSPRSASPAAPASAMACARPSTRPASAPRRASRRTRWARSSTTRASSRSSASRASAPSRSSTRSRRERPSSSAPTA